jgi:hypothetical protein
VYGMWELNPYNSYGRDAFGVNFQVNCIFVFGQELVLLKKDSSTLKIK